MLDERARALKFERGPGIHEGQTTVYLVRGDLAVRTPVHLGAMSIGEVEVLSGLKPGDQVITSDLRDYRDAPEILLAN